MIVVSVTGDEHVTLQFDKDVVTVGRAPNNDVVINHPNVSGRHLRIARGSTQNIIEDLHSMHGSVVVADGQQLALQEGAKLFAEFDTCCSVRLGPASTPVVIEVSIPEVSSTHVVSMHSIDHLHSSKQDIDRDVSTLQRLYSAQQRLDGAATLDDVLLAIGDGVLELVPRATHVTITLREDDQIGRASCRERV